jgi:ligand-binding SRPBCC domain-containing protein
MRVARIEKEIMINASLEKIFNFVDNPTDLIKIWPSLMVVKNTQSLPNGGYTFEYVYKMAGKLLEGTAEYTDKVQNSRLTVKTKGAIDATMTWTFRSNENLTRVTLSVDYRLPLSVSSLLNGNVAIAMNDREAEVILNNLRAVFEEISMR